VGQQFENVAEQETRVAPVLEPVDELHAVAPFADLVGRPEIARNLLGGASARAPIEAGIEQALISRPLDPHGARKRRCGDYRKDPIANH
jgi:hypothetical protein